MKYNYADTVHGDTSEAMDAHAAMAKLIEEQEYDQEVQLYCTECGARYELTLDDLREVSRFGKVYCPECEDREPVNNVRELHILWLN